MQWLLLLRSTDSRRAGFGSCSTRALGHSLGRRCRQTLCRAGGAEGRGSAPRGSRCPAPCGGWWPGRPTPPPSESPRGCSPRAEDTVPCPLHMGSWVADGPSAPPSPSRLPQPCCVRARRWVWGTWAALSSLSPTSFPSSADMLHGVWQVLQGCRSLLKKHVGGRSLWGSAHLPGSVLRGLCTSVRSLRAPVRGTISCTRGRDAS